MVIHTCWLNPDWDGEMAPGACTGCDLARANPCEWCGYGHVFATHNPLAHAENGDPAVQDMDDVEDEWPEELWGAPYDPALLSPEQQQIVLRPCRM